MEGGCVSVGVYRRVGGMQRWEPYTGAELLGFLICSLTLSSLWPYQCMARGLSETCSASSITWLDLLYRPDKCFKNYQGYKGDLWKDIPIICFGSPLPCTASSQKPTYLPLSKRKKLICRWISMPQPGRNVNVVLAFSTLPSSLDLELIIILLE